MNFSTNGSERVRITSTGNVGIGTTSPIAKLHVEGDKTYSLGYLDKTSDLHIGNDTMSSAVGAYAGSITFGSTNESNIQAASIVAVQTDTDPNEIGLAFFTQHSSAGSTDLLESMRIKNDGSVGIGNTAPTFYSGYSTIALGGTSSTSKGLIKFGSETSNDGPEIFTNTSKDLYFNKAGSGTNMILYGTGTVRFNNYNSSNQTGTPTYLLGTDASGNVVKTLSTPGGDPGPYLPLAGGTMVGTTRHGDNVTSYWGTGDDLEIYHNSSGDSVIQNHVGDLYLTNKADNKDIIFRTDNGSGGFENYIQIGS
jgi:hypothetical protein